MKKRFKNGQKSDWDQTKSDDSVWWATYPTGAASVCADDVFELTVPPPEKLPDRALEVHTFQFWDTDEEASFIVVLGYVSSEILIRVHVNEGAHGIHLIAATSNVP